MIAVVDDFPDASELVVRLLRKEALEAVALRSGDELFNFLEISQPTLIILDISMPEMTGIECLAKLAQHSIWKDIPVLVYSADFSEAVYQQARRLGARGYVVKGTLGWDKVLPIIRECAKVHGP